MVDDERHQRGQRQKRDRDLDQNCAVLAPAATEIGFHVQDLKALKASACALICIDMQLRDTRKVNRFDRIGTAFLNQEMKSLAAAPHSVCRFRRKVPASRTKGDVPTDMMRLRRRTALPRVASPSRRTGSDPGV